MGWIHQCHRAQGGFVVSCSVTQPCPTLCDLKDCGMPGFPFLLPLCNSSLLPSLPSPGNHWSAFCQYKLVCIFCNFSISGIIQYVLFVWLFSLNPVILGFIHVVCINKIVLNFMDMPQFSYPFYCWEAFGLFPVWGCYKAALNIYV